MFVTRVNGSFMIVAQRSGVTKSQWISVRGGAGICSRSGRGISWLVLVWLIWRVVLTDEGQADEERDADDQANDVEEEVLVVVHSNAGVYPWTVAGNC